MIIPQPGTLGIILHKDVEQNVFVHQVTHEWGVMWRVTLRAASDVFAMGDTLSWIGNGGTKTQSFVRELQCIAGETFVTIVLSERAWT